MWPLCVVGSDPIVPKNIFWNGLSAIVVISIGGFVCFFEVLFFWHDRLWVEQRSFGFHNAGGLLASVYYCVVPF